MLVKPPRDERKPFRIIPEQTTGDKVVTYVQVALIFLVVRIVMLVGGVTFIRIPGLDYVLGQFIHLLRVWFEK